MRILLTLLSIFVCLHTLSAQTLPHRQYWVDSIYSSLSEDERIGQLFSVRAHSDKGPEHIREVERAIKKYHVGGLCFFQGTPEKQAELTNRYQAMSRELPLMISMDAEWGLGMRLKENSISFPRQLSLGAVQDNRLIYEMGKEVAYQLRRLGVHVNFAPVVDVNNNAANPVINTRSFGEDRYNVAVKSYMYMRGMQDNGVLACAKHFPGHGDTDVDSHLDLPVIAHDRQRLDSIELFPFRILAEQGVAGMMIAHLAVPALEARENMPTSLSRGTVTDLLRNQYGFEGLIWTDGLGMKGVTKHYRPGEVEARALQAGADVLLLPQDLEAARTQIRAWLADGRIEPAQFEQSVKRVLADKYRLGLTRPQRVLLTNLRSDLNNDHARALKRELSAAALTVVRNPSNLIPFRDLDGVSFASLALGQDRPSNFQTTLGRYADFRHFQAGKTLSATEQKRLVERLEKFDVVVVGLHDMSSYAQREFGISSSQLELIETLRQRTKVVLTVFGNPYALAKFPNVEYLLVAYDDDADTQDIAAQGLFGALPMRGKLPVTAGPNARYGQGIETPNLFRLGFSRPEEVGISSRRLASVDTLMEEMVDKGAAPGGVLLVAKDGKIVHWKAYGYHKYDKHRPVRRDDVFDLASVTKVMASTLSAMKLHEENKLSIYEPMQRYVSDLDTTNKVGLTVRDMMAHRARLRPWIPFYTATVDRKQRPLEAYYRPRSEGDFYVPVTDRLYLLQQYRDTIWQKIYSSPLRSQVGYKYSDLGFYLVGKMVENVSGQRLDRYASENFYKPLGLQRTGFNPTTFVSKSEIPPTEKDKYWRQEDVHGYVHDMGAAMMGGVAGHAGLFSTAKELAVLGQMLLNGGYYGGRRYLEPETIEVFTRRCETCTRRAVGWDMLQLDPRYNANLSTLASTNTFGHLGFTGTAVWIDPDENLIFVFLSNRTYPTMKNNKLGRYNYRPRTQDAVYRAIERRSSATVISMRN